METLEQQIEQDTTFELQCKISKIKELYFFMKKILINLIKMMFFSLITIIKNPVDNNTINNTIIQSLSPLYDDIHEDFFLYIKTRYRNKLSNIK